MKNEKCTWCNKKVNDKEFKKSIDASDVVHTFHLKCWKEHCKWLKELIK